MVIFPVQEMVNISFCDIYTGQYTYMINTHIFPEHALQSKS